MLVISIPVKKIDLESASWLSMNQICMTLIFKHDEQKKKRSGRKRPEENMEDSQELMHNLFHMLLVSC